MRKVRPREKVKLSLTIDSTVAENLRKLSPLSSPFVSVLLKHLFDQVGVDEIYLRAGLERPLPMSERIRRLERFVRTRVRIVTAGEPEAEKTLSAEDFWERSEG